MMDEQGMLVQEELPWWQQPGDPNPELEALLKHQLDVTVERDYNRPSILSWGVSNEVYHNTEQKRLPADDRPPAAGTRMHSVTVVVESDLYHSGQRQSR